MSGYKTELIQKKADGTLVFRTYREKTENKPKQRECPHCGEPVYYRYFTAKDGNMYARIVAHPTRKYRMRDTVDEKNGPTEFHCPHCEGEIYYRWYKNRDGEMHSKLSTMSREEYEEILHKL